MNEEQIKELKESVEELQDVMPEAVNIVQAQDKAKRTEEAIALYNHIKGLVETNRLIEQLKEQEEVSNFELEMLLEDMEYNSCPLGDHGCDVCKETV